jgi:hypothetical protein
MSRKWKPQRWSVGLNRVAPDCRWAWRGLVLGWPLWDTGFDNAVGTVLEGYKLQDPTRRGLDGYLIGSVASGVEFVAGARGTVAKVVNGTQGRITTRPSDAPFLPTGPTTVILHYRKTGGNVNVGAFGMVAFETGPQIFGAHLPYGDGNIYWDYGGFAGNNRLTLSSAGITLSDDNVWAFTNGPRGMEIWLNGARRAVNAVEVTRTASTAASFGFGLFHKDNVVNDSAESGAFLVYDRQLSEAELGALMIDPWTPFRPARRTGAKAGVGGGGGTGARSFVPAIIG